MESSKCIICSSYNCENIIYNEGSQNGNLNRKVEPDVVKTFYEFLIRNSSNKFLSSLRFDNIWTSIPEFSYFCLTCQRKVVGIFDLSSEIKTIQTTIQWLVLQIKLNILKSMSTLSVQTRNICKIVSRESDTHFYSKTLSDKIDCFRSLAVIEYQPDVILTKEIEHFTSLVQEVNADRRKFRCYWKKTSGVISSKYTNAILETEMIRVKRIGKKLLSMTDGEMKKYFTCMQGMYKCQTCQRKIRSKKDAIKHLISIHKKVERYKCKYCKKGYFYRNECIRHIIQNHEEMRDNNKTVQMERQKSINCINCYKPCNRKTEEAARLSKDILSSYSEILNINYLHPYFNWTSDSSEDDSSLFCDSCYNSVGTLCDLNSKRKEMLRSIENVVLQIKADILVSMSQELNKINVCKTLSSQDEFYKIKEVGTKVDFIRSAVVQEFYPDLQLFKVDLPSLSNKLQKLNMYKSRFSRTFQKNSILLLLNEDECICLNPGLTAISFALTDEEMEFYFESDVDDKKFKCRLCSNKATMRYAAEVHVNKYHKQLKMFECKYCGEQFFLKRDCASHIINGHKNERRLDENIAAPLPQLNLTTPDGIIDLGINAAPVLRRRDIKKLANEKYQCGICQVIHKKRSSLVKHQKATHLGMYRHQCEFCGFKHFHKSRIVYHIQNVHADEIKRRNIVYENVNTRDANKKNIATKKRLLKAHLDLDGINLIECKRPTADVEEYFTAALLGYTCNYCGKTLTRRTRMVHHVGRLHLGIRTCECVICEKRFYSIQECKEHIRKRHAKAQHKSTVISGDIVSERNADESSHSNKEEYFTDLKHDEDLHYRDSCTEEMKPEVNRNPIETNDGLSKIIAAEDLDETNMNCVKIEAHMDTLDTNWENESVECGKWQEKESDGISLQKNLKYFKTEYSDTNHSSKCDNLSIEQEQEERKISESWNYSSSIVSKGEQPPVAFSMLNGDAEMPKSQVEKTAFLYTFIKEGDIIIHPQVDMSEILKYFKKFEKNYKCLKCGKVLGTESGCRRHAEDIHHVVKRYQCSNCLKFFYSKFHCADHFVVKHTGHKIYQCSICGKALSSNTSLQTHIKTHLHREFSCAICSLKFTTDRYLETHYKNIHKTILPI